MNQITGKLVADPAFSHVMIVGRKRDGSVDIKAKVPVRGERNHNATQMLLVPDYKGSSPGAYSLARQIARKFEPDGKGVSSVS